MDRGKMYFRKVLTLMRQCDVALEVVDARDIPGTRTRKLDMPMRSKVVIIASKEDLIPRDAERHPFIENIPIVYFSARTREGMRDVIGAIRASPRARDLRERNLRIRVAVFGMPNTGKSSLINVLRGKRVAVTGFRPGITRGEQWINIGEDILLCDTPGIVRFGVGERELAEKGGLDAERLADPEKVARGIIAKFVRLKDSSIFDFYKIERAEGDAAIEKLARRRGLLMKGGEPNVEEAAKIIVRDFQKGKFVPVDRR